MGTYHNTEREDVGRGVLHCSCPRFGASQEHIPRESLFKTSSVRRQHCGVLQVCGLYISKLKGAIAILKQVHYNVDRFNVYQVQAAVDMINWLIGSEELTVALHVLKEMGHGVDFEDQRCDILGWEVCWAVGRRR